MSRSTDVLTSSLATAIRFPSGLSVGTLGPRPKQPVELFEFEACPFCRKVREALTILDLEAIIRPCPKGGPRYRLEVERRGGKQMFPYLVDPNTGKETYESDDIVHYLFETYGDGRVPWQLAPGALTTLTLSLASAPRPSHGVRYEASNPPELPLELYSFEGSPYCRIVREVLCSLELAYRLHNVAKGSPSRTAFVQRSGRMMVPWLRDPNTGTEMFESADITTYLRTTYARQA